MNRLHHLANTLPVNISNNEDYPNLEFVLLDYNSTDGLEEFVRDKMFEHLKSGKLIYYKTNTPKYFNRSHSRNLCFKLASGDIICNIDADNYTGRGFASFVNEAFKNDDIFLTTIGLRQELPDILGRICMRRQDFERLGGFDERMINYGFEDHDIVKRLELKGVKAELIDSEAYLEVIPHTEEERVSNEFVSRNLRKILINFKNPASSEILFLFHNKEFLRGTMLNNTMLRYYHPRLRINDKKSIFEYSLLKNRWTKGTWKENDNIFRLTEGSTHQTLEFNEHERIYYSGQDSSSIAKYYEITEPEMVQKATMFYSQLSNRIVMENNLKYKRVVVNKKGFGKDKVYKNFNYHLPIPV